MTDKNIWILGDLRSRRYWQQSLIVLTKALRLTANIPGTLSMILMGASNQDKETREAIDNHTCLTLYDAAQEAVSSGVHAVYCIEHPHLAIPRTDTYAQVLTEMITSKIPWLVLVPLNEFGREISAVCAQHCQTGLIAECDELVYDAGQIVGRCPAWGGQILADISPAEGWPTTLITVRPHGEKPEPDVSRKGRIETVIPGQVKINPGMTLLTRSRSSLESRRLEEAQIVVTGGAGMGDMRGFGTIRDLAAALGGEVGATRPPVRHHWVDEQRLIGQTGKTVRPELLISVGTSGAIQYTAGVMESKLIVAINRDPAAPIFQVADIGIVADAAAILPALTQRIKQITMRRLADAACYLDDAGSAPASGFGAMVQQLREARNWSVDEMASKTGQTPDFVCQVEADQMSPPVGFIMRMAQALQVDPGTFLNQEEKATIRDQRTQAYIQRTQNYSYATLTPDAENSHLRAFMVSIEPHLAHKPVAYKHEGEEFIFVMMGELEFTLGTKTQVLKTGESIHFNSDVPHKLKNLSSQVTQCLVVLYTI